MNCCLYGISTVMIPSSLFESPCLIVAYSMPNLLTIFEAMRGMVV